MYGKTINGVLYVVQEPREGYKPFAYTTAPDAPDGYHAAYFWRETEDRFMQTWEIVKDSEDELTDDEALAIILGGGDA